MAKILQAIVLLFLTTLAQGYLTESQCPYGRPKITYKNEVFAFMTTSDNKLWKRLPWDKLTTLGLFMEPIPKKLICMAHKHQVRVIKAIDFDGKILGNTTARAEKIKSWVNYVKINNIDGLNIDFEEPVSNGSPKKLQLTNFIKNLSNTLHTAVPGSQISYDMPFGPDGIYGRNYDSLEISKSLDFILIMAYDEAQGPYANSNSGYEKTFWGAQRYIDIGVPPSKLVIAFPWYGYAYQCSALSANHVCSLESGSKEIAYVKMESYFKQYAITDRLWDETAQSPFFDTKVNGVLGQVRYDDPRSLRLKSDIALKLGLLGVGMWTANYGDFNNTHQWNNMWSSMPYSKSEILLP